jgi:hypothetical protein
VRVCRFTVELARRKTGPVLCITNHVLRSKYKKNESTRTLVMILRVTLSAVTFSRSANPLTPNDL